MAPAVWNFFIGYYVGTGIAVVGLYIAFILPVILRYRMGDRFEPGAWSLGRHYKWIDRIAIGWVALVCVLFFLPPFRASFWGQEGFTWEFVNYAPLLVGFVLLVVGSWYFLSAKKWFKGPVRQGTEEELEAIEKRLEATPS